MDPDDREFMRQLTLRHERATREMVAELRELQRETAASTATLIDAREESSALREDSRAHTQSIFRLIDRIDELGRDWPR